MGRSSHRAGNANFVTLWPVLADLRPLPAKFARRSMQKMHRREFLTWSIAGGCALALNARANAKAKSLSPWITLHADGSVTLVTTSLEMGQGSRTGQAQILADELDVRWEAIRVVLAPEQDPYLIDGALYSGGSETLRTRYDLLRRAGASVRQQLISAAALLWQVPASSCEAALGLVTHAGTGRSLAYGALAERAAAIAPPANPVLKRPEQRRYIGKSVSTLDMEDKVTGRARYGIDFRLPRMKFATIRQCPSFGGMLSGVDEKPALALPGVHKVIRFSDAVAVVADSTYEAMRGAAALDPRWTTANPVPNSEEISRRLAAGIAGADAIISPRKGGKEAREKLRVAYAAASRRHEASYEIAYLSHSPLEPMNATARATANGVEIWAPCQSPTWARDDVMRMTGLKKEAITVHPLLMGGGFGRRLKGDYAGRAAQVALAGQDAVQVLWTREEDLTHDFYRPAMHAVLRAALPEDGFLTGYEFLAASADDLTGGSAPLPYSLAGYAATLTKVKIGVPIGSWRSVDPGMSLFAKESFIDECAHLANQDPLAYRDKLLGANERARRVLRNAAAAAGWPGSKRADTGMGLALLQEWNSIVAHVIEVEMTGTRVRVKRIVTAMDCGTAVNPQQVRAQLEGGSLFGLSAALGEKITLSGGRVEQRNFDGYRLLRIGEAPQVDAILLDTPDAAVGGVGEPPVPGVAPALANAIFAATGKRLRRLPLTVSVDGELTGSNS
jgi:isoquinoline 1-oxidoreductase subunit beta